MGFIPSVTQGVITFENHTDPSSGTTIDLVWVNQQADDSIVACVVYENNVLNHHSDHRAMVTVISIKRDTASAPETLHPSEKNWHKVDQAKFLLELKALLPPLSHITTDADIDTLDNLLLTAMTTALSNSSPVKTRQFKHKSWWNPTTMQPLRQAAAKARRQAKTHPTNEHRAMYRSTRNQYFWLIENEKINSWRRYLSTLTVETLFQAKKYSSGPRPSPLISTLVTANGDLCVSNEDKAEALFSATCVATSTCNIQDVPPSPFPRQTIPNATYLPPPSPFFSKSAILESLQSTHPMKAPGPDCIQTWMWVLAWDALSNHLLVLFNAITTRGYIPPR